MYQVLLLTDNSHFGTIASQLSYPGNVYFDYIILSDNIPAKHHIPKNDFKNILTACKGKDTIILQISGNQAVYIVDVILNEKDFTNCQFIILQSPLIDFYYRPNEDYFVDWAIRRKLKNHPVTFTIIRPFSAYFIRYKWTNYPFPDKYLPFLLPEIQVFGHLFINIGGKLPWNEVIYMLPKPLSSHPPPGLNTFKKKLILKLLRLFHFEIFKNRSMGQRWLEEDALIHFIRHVTKLQHKIFIDASENTVSQTNSHQIHNEKKFNNT